MGSLEKLLELSRYREQHCCCPHLEMVSALCLVLREYRNS